MFKWCSYCQKLLAEIEPFDVFEFSHGICPSCTKNMRWTSAFSNSVEQLAEFHREVLEAGRKGNLARAPDLLKKGLNLGIRPLDFLAGFIQPALYKIGSEWEAGKVSIAEEHQFTAFSNHLVDLCFLELSRNNAPHSHPVDVLLVNAPGNYHVIGLRIIELWLIHNDHSPLTIFPGLPLKEVLQMVSEVKPKYVGISIADTKQQEFITELKVALANLAPSSGESPILLVGGPALRRKEWKRIQLEGVYYCNDIFSLEQMITAQKSKTQSTSETL